MVYVEIIDLKTYSFYAQTAILNKVRMAEEIKAKLFKVMGGLCILETMVKRTTRYLQCPEIIKPPAVLLSSLIRKKLFNGHALSTAI
jgi:hypothetical protein